MSKKISTEEKIDYIYKNLYKKERREKIIFYSKLLVAIIFILYLMYIYYIVIPAFKKDLIESLKIELPTINKEKIIDTGKNILEKGKNLFN